jgi:hypothetical protein
LSIAAATLGGLPDRLAAAVGVFAIALITYFALADADSGVLAGVFLLPLAVSFALQPFSRDVFKDAPTRSQLVTGTPTRRAVDLALRELGSEPRVLTLVREFPSELALDLGFAGYGALAPRVQANGYDPMSPLSTRRVLGEMGARGVLTERSLMPDVDLLRRWSIEAVQVQTVDLVRGTSETDFDTTLEPGGRRVCAFPFLRLKKITVNVRSGKPTTLNIFARVNGDRDVLIGAAVSSGGPVSVAAPFYRADAVTIEVAQGSPGARIHALEVETADGLHVQASPLSAYLSQPGFLELVATPQIRVFRVMGPRPLVDGAQPARLESGLAPGGRLTFTSDAEQSVQVAVPFLSGWRGAPVSEVMGGLKVDAKAGETVRLKYVPPLLLPGVVSATLGLLATLLLLMRPAIIGGLLKTRRDEGK